MDYSSLSTITFQNKLGNGEGGGPVWEFVQTDFREKKNTFTEVPGRVMKKHPLRFLNSYTLESFLLAVFKVESWVSSTKQLRKQNCHFCVLLFVL